ncbi:hypothetical protein Gotur_028499 [Gossypium turneri]
MHLKHIVKFSIILSFKYSIYHLIVKVVRQ